MKKRAFTLIEMMIAIGVIALLALFALPAAKALWASFEQAPSRSMTSSLLACSRAIASGKCYAGVWFKLKDGQQWAIPVMQDPNTNHYFDAKTIVLIKEPGRQPIRLKEGIVSIDFDANDITILFSSQGKLVIKPVALYPNETIKISQRGLVFYDSKEWERCKTEKEKELFIKSLKPTFVNTYTGRFIQ